MYLYMYLYRNPSRKRCTTATTWGRRCSCHKHMALSNKMAQIEKQGNLTKCRRFASSSNHPMGWSNHDP